MNIGARYKLLGKKKRAVLDMPYSEVLNTFEDALVNSPAAEKLTGTVDRDSGIFKVEYKISDRKNDVYENYCMLAEISEKKDGTTKIEYAFVYDRFLSWYTKFLSFICFIVPLVAALVVYFKFNLDFTKPLHLILYIPLLLISSFGVFSLFGYKEKQESVKPMVKQFEEMLVSAFDGE